MGTTAWIYWLCGGAGSLAGLSLLCWALFRDRSRGRRRCPRCWYDMAGVPGLICPECGRNARRERRLFKTRRRPRTALAALAVLLAGTATAAIPLYAARGIYGFLPTEVLVRVVPSADYRPPNNPTTGLPDWDPAAAELQRRIHADALSSRHWAILVQRAELIQTRGFCGRDEAPSGSLAYPWWFDDQVAPPPSPPSDALEIFYRPRGGAHRWELLRWSDAWLDRSCFARSEDDNDGFECTVDIVIGRYAWPERKHTGSDPVLWRGHCARTIRIVDSVTEAMRPCEDAEVNKAIARSITDGAVLATAADGRRSVEFTLDVSDHPRARRTAVGLCYELSREGIALQSGQLESDEVFTYSSQGSSFFEKRYQVALPHDRELAGLVLRIFGDPAVAAEQDQLAEYWPGEVTLNLDKLNP